MKLSEINQAIFELERLLDELEQSESPPEDQLEQIKQAIEQMEGQREEKLLNIARWRKQLQTEAKEIIGGEIKRLQDRKKAYENRVKSLGDYLYWGLQEVEGKKIKSPIGTLYIQRNSAPKVEVIDHHSLDDRFWTPVETVSEQEPIELSPGYYNFIVETDGKIVVRKLDYKAISDWHIKTGEIPEGTKIEWGSHVKFR